MILRHAYVREGDDWPVDVPFVVGKLWEGNRLIKICQRNEGLDLYWVASYDLSEERIGW